MNEDYLWDGSGSPDPDVEHLERALRLFRFHGPPQRLGETGRVPRMRWLAAAAAVVLIGGWLFRFPPAPSAATAWQVAAVEGTARLGTSDARLAMAVRSGQAVRTGVQSELTLEADPVGRIDLGPDSELRASTDRTVLLRHGELHAFIWARPRDFVVETPSARAVDLGCEYTLKVDEGGNGLVRVSMGWVAFEYYGRESFIPAGAECVTRPRSGPGIPYYEDAPEPLRRALFAFENGERSALPAVLSQARSRDALTLWHLLTRAAASERGVVFDRFARLILLPPGVKRSAVVAGDAHSIDLCWNALNLQDTSWWRGWERPWK